MSDSAVTIDWMESNKTKATRSGERENYLKVIRREQPDWVPVYRDACDWVFPGFMIDYIFSDEKFDMYGVEWIVHEYGEMPKEDRRMLDDITKWREFVRIPDTSGFDWEAIAKKDLSEHDPDKALCYFAGVSCGSFFIPLMNMMGFEEGLCALLEEPDACHDLFETMTQFNENVMRHLIPLYKPDVVLISDDIASAQAPFISMGTFEEMFLPYYKRMIDVSLGFGVPVEFHMCGKAEKLIRKLHENGVSIWEPAQTMNDLEGIKKDFGNSLVFNGGFDSQGIAGMVGADEATVRASVRDSIDRYAPGGGYVFWDLDPVGQDQDMVDKISWCEDEARRYGSTFYTK